jgi:sialic acid synthase SpsE
MWVYLYTEEQMRDEYNNDKRYIWAIILMDYFTKNLNVSGVRALSEYQSIVKKIGSFSPYDETSDRFLNPMAVQYLKIMSNKPEYKYLEKIIEGVQNYKYVITQ